jgi:hypothetical protein
MLLKNLPIAALLWVIPARLILDGIAGIYFGLKDGFPHLWAVVKHILDFMLKLRKHGNLEVPLKLKIITKPNG